MSDKEPTDVALGVLIAKDGRFLMGSRPKGKVYAGYWEFPGGKVEKNESIEEALRREMHEELALELAEVVPWFVKVFVYPHDTVRLHFCRCFNWKGEPRPQEEQSYGFFSLKDLPEPILPASVPILPWLTLKDEIVIVRQQYCSVLPALVKIASLASHGVKMVCLDMALTDSLTREEFLWQVAEFNKESEIQVFVRVKSLEDPWLSCKVGTILDESVIREENKERLDKPVFGVNITSRDGAIKAVNAGASFAIAVEREFAREAPLPVYIAGEENINELLRIGAQGAARLR